MDKLKLYRWAVQDSETHAKVFCTMYQQLRHGRQPLVLRKDFVGATAETGVVDAKGLGRRNDIGSGYRSGPAQLVPNIPGGFRRQLVLRRNDSCQ